MTEGMPRISLEFNYVTVVLQRSEFTAHNTGISDHTGAFICRKVHNKAFYYNLSNSCDLQQNLWVKHSLYKQTALDIFW